MKINQKAVRALSKVFDAGFTDEKEISAMTIDDILAMPGVTMADISLINELQKSIKTSKIISFLREGPGESAAVSGTESEGKSNPREKASF